MPAEGMVGAGEVALHHVSWGHAAAPPVVCLHGAGGNARHWGPLARDLASRGLRTVALDLRGHGDSDKPETGYEPAAFASDVEQALRGLGVERCAMVGASLGSRVALTVAASNPDLVSRLVLVDLSFEMPVEAQQRMMEGHRRRPSRFRSLAEVVEWSRSNPSRSRWSPELHEELAPFEVREDDRGDLVWKYRPEAAIDAIAAARRDMWAMARSLTMPTLLLRGAESPVLTPESAARMVEEIPGCRLVEVERAGHGVPRDNPRVFNAVVGDFLVEG